MTNQKMVQTRNVSTSCLYNTMLLYVHTRQDSSSRYELYCSEVCGKFFSLWQQDIVCYFYPVYWKLTGEMLNWNVFGVNCVMFNHHCPIWT
jgi:hypothetical protein